MKFCKIGLLLLFTLAPFSLSAITPDSPPATPQPVSLVNLTAAPSSFVNNSVNAMSGDYIFSSQEYISSGPDPYMLGATNISSSEMKSSIGYSTDFQHLHLLKVFQPAGIEFKDPMSPKKNYTHLYIFEPFGGKILFRGSKHGKHLEPVLKDTGYTNSSQGIIDGKNHIKNWKVWWDSSTNEWHVTTGSGATRIYGQRFRNKHKRKPGYYNYYFRDYHITEEKKPSGNRVFYSYDKEYRIEKIKTMSSDKSETLHWVTFEYAPDNSRVTVATSDALTYVYKLKKMKTRKGDERFFIDSIERPGRAAEKLEYGETTAFHNPRIERSGEEKGPYLKTKYYHRLGANDIGDFKPQISDPKRRKFLAGRVRLQKAPAGAGGDEIITHSYFYHRNDEGEIDCTTVVDPYGTKVRYFYDESTRLKRIEHEKDGKILMAECFVWGEEGKEQEGCLLARTLYDETNTIQLSYTYDYDSHFNVIQETLYGNFTGASKGAITLDSKGLPRKDSNVDRKVWHFTYSDDIYNLKLSEIDPLGNHTYFSYYKETNLLQSRFTCEGKSIRKREFFKYDHAGCLVKETVDDGTERERNNLKNVTYRAIKRIVPRRSCPHYGAAEEISEYYLELESKREILLRKTVNSFNSKGLVAKKRLYDEKARHVATSSFEYDQAHRLIYSKDPLDREQFFSYDPSGRLILKKGPRKDLEERYSYDAMGRLIAMHELHTNGLELTSRVEYDFIGRKCTTIDPQGNQTKYEYDSLNRVTKIILPATVLMTHELKSGVRSFRYKNLSTHVTETDERGYETEREYSATGKLLRERLPDGTERTVCYDLLDRPTMQREPNRLTSLTTYDYLGRALTVVQKIDHDILLRESKKYSTFFLLEETQATGERIRYFYDAAGRKSRVQKIGDSHTPDRVTSYQYDALGRLQKEIRHLEQKKRSILEWDYDLLDRPIEESIKDEAGRVHFLKLLSYDSEGSISELTQFVQGKKAITKTTYMPHGTPQKIEDALGNTTHFSINYFYKNRFGQYVVQKSSIDARGVKTIETLNTRGKTTKIEQFDPYGALIAKKWIYYDLAGNQEKIDELLLSAADSKVVTTALSYGPLNRLEALTEAADTPENKITCFSYNRLGQKYKTTLATGAELRLEYDAKGRVARHYDTKKSFDYHYEYDARDRIMSVKNGLTEESTHRQYNVFGELARETYENSASVSYSYDRLGRIEKLTLPDGSSIAYGYSPVHLSSITRVQENGKSYSFEIQARDFSGHIESCKLPLNGGTLSYTYDALGKVTGVKHPEFQESIGYDSVGNLLMDAQQSSFGAVASSYSYDSLSQLISESGAVHHSYTVDSLYNRLKKDDVLYQVNALHSVVKARDMYEYDANGNRTKKSEKGNETRHFYDSLDRLTRLDTASTQVSYSYDAFDRRMKKQLFAKSSDGARSVEKEERFLYAGQNEIGTMDSKGKIIELRVLGEGLGAEIGAAIALELNGTVSIPIHDQRGNVSMLLSADSGKIEEQYRYSAFGEETSTCKTPKSPWRFSSKRVDKESGLLFFGRRYYDPEIGSWLTRDPLGLKAGPNLYAYVRNNPMTHVDPYGLEGQEANFPRNAVGLIRDYGPDSSTKRFSDAFERKQNGNCIDVGARDGIRLFNGLLGHLIPSNPVTDCVRDGLHSLTYNKALAKQSSTCITGIHGDQYEKYDIPIYLHINGVLNTRDDTLKARETIQNKLGAATQNNTISIYSATGGLVADACELVANLLGFHTHPSRITTRTVHKIIEAHKNNPSQVLIHILPHSHGCAIADVALKELSEKELSRISTCTFGPTKLLTRQEHHVAQAINHVSRADFTTLVCNPIGFVRAVVNPERMDTKFIGSRLQIPMSSHAFHSNDYQTALIEYAHH